MDIHLYLKTSLQEDLKQLRKSIETAVWLKMLAMNFPKTLKVCSEDLERLSPDTNAIELMQDDDELGVMHVKTDGGETMCFQMLTLDEMYAIAVQLDLL